MTAVCQVRKRPFMQAARLGSRPTRAERRSRSGSLIRADRLKTVMPATSSMLAERATRNGSGGGLPPPAWRMLR
jgi:hypothetical protein